MDEHSRNSNNTGQAVTGSGKTLAFLIPLVEKLLRLEEPMKKHHVAAIIISPTRELASQIYTVLRSLLAFHGPSAAAARRREKNPEGEDDEEDEYPPSTLAIRPQLLLGGDVSTTQDLRSFLDHSPNLLISTPGRLLELLSSPNVRCPQSSFEVLVLDEADRLLDLGFKEDLQKILGRLPKQRRTGLFSASVSEAVDQLVRVGLRNPVKIAVKVKSLRGGEDQRTPSSLQMRSLAVKASHKLPTTAKLLHTLHPTPGKTIIYLSTCAAVDYFQHILPQMINTQHQQKFTIVPLHGKHPPKVRSRNFTAFSTALLPSILLTTDVAARGLDIPQVDLVVQVDPPTDPKVFIHRCGRAGRAGRAGLSVLLLRPGREEDYVPFLEVRKTPVTPLTKPTVSVSDTDAQDTTSTIRSIVLKDRALHDLAQRAFVSGIKSYSKHQASSIFRVSDFDWIDLANAWGLLKLPRMPELRNWEGDWSLGLQVDFEAYGYRDKKREEARKERLHMSRRTEKEGEKDTGSQNNRASQQQQKRPWSEKLDQREERERRREKKRVKREAEKWNRMTPEEREKREELERMIEEVKTRRKLDDEGEHFEGFDD